MRKRTLKLWSGILSAAMAVSAFCCVQGEYGVHTARAAASAVNTAEFASPGKAYQPGVRWWWSGGAVEKEELIREIDYLAEQNIGYVEINPFGKQVEDPQAANIYTKEFYELLDVAVTEAEKKGITVDLNMGSGWNANSQFVQLEDSMGNMALGRKTLDGGKPQDVSSTIAIPQAEKSIFYYGSAQKGEWSEKDIQLQGVLVAELTGEKGEDYKPKTSFMTGMTSAYNEFTGADGQEIKYASPVQISAENSVFIDAGDDRIKDGVLILKENDLTFHSDKQYEVIAMYYLPTGAQGIDSATDWYVVDHMDGQKAAKYVNEWLGEANMKALLDKHKNIRAIFNDSYEFYSDNYYTESLYDLAKDSAGNGLGYDFAKYLPTIYKEYSAAPFYMGLGTAEPFLTYTLNAEEKARITYDYNTLVGARFAEGMEGFQSAAADHGVQYRQEAYNPPIDTIAAARYVDIPEAEQGNEMGLIRVSSGAHLYGRNLVTCEQYTLGCTPFKNTLEQVKIGYDNMATSGVNNFFYHGFSYRYGKDTEAFGENGWSPMAGTGINVTETNTLSPYFPEMNLYAARVNYLMQQGSPSKDVALYMPYNGSLSETDAVKAMNYNGIAWDAINDASIQAADTIYKDGKISANGGKMTYQAIVVEGTTLPVATMEKLKELAAAGATVILYGNAPAKQPGYADGKYAAEDAKVAACAAEIIAQESGSNPKTMADLEKALSSVKPAVTYEKNTNARFARRTLSDGGELVYIRNIGTSDNTITVKADSKYQNFYWMDQNSGKIYRAQADNGVITAKFGASADSYSNKNSMALALLCEPAGVELAESSLSEGTPYGLITGDTKAASVKEEATLEMQSLTVTADNLDGEIGGKAETVVYTENVLGKWNDPGFHGGALQKVVADGIYKTSYKLISKSPLKRAVLKLNNVYTAAAVKVNGKVAGKVMYQPYTLDITSYLNEGENAIEITVTPRKMNRYYNTSNGQYSSKELIDTGMEGPAVLELTLAKEGWSQQVDSVKQEAEAAKKQAQAALEAANKALQEAQKKLADAQNKGSADIAKAQAELKEAQAARQEAEKKLKDLQNENARMKFSAKKLTLKSVKAKKKSAKVTWKKITGANGYVIQYATNSKFKKAKKVTIKKGSTTTKTVSKLTGGKKYYVRVRAYKTIGGKKAYTSYSAVKKVTPKKK